MGDSPGQGSDGLHFLSLAQLLFQAFSLGYIPLSGDIVADFTMFIQQGGDYHIHFKKGAVFITVDKMSPPVFPWTDSFPHLPVIFIGMFSAF